MKKSLLVVIAGPTAVGKTSLSIELAKFYETSILSADSRQFYKEMEIGTAKPSKEELSLVDHHFINSHSVQQEYDAGSFSADANELLLKFFQEKEIILAVGGSGLYIKALCEGLDEMPDVPGHVREELVQQFDQNGLDPLLKELEKKDPDYYKMVDKHNHQRVLRALEIIRHTGRTYSSLRNTSNRSRRPYQVLKIAIQEDRESLYSRINERMDVMIEEGLFDEAKSLEPYAHLNALQTVGYREIFGYLKGEYDKKEAIRLLKRNSRRYAKRQMTWFRNDSDFHWFGRDEIGAIKELIKYTLIQP